MSGDGRLPDEAARRERVVRALRDACLGGDAGALLAADVSAVVELADGDRVALRGREQVGTRLVSAVAGADEVSLREVNSQPGLVLVAGGRVTGVVSLRIPGALVSECWVLLNPGRLTRFR